MEGVKHYRRDKLDADVPPVDADMRWRAITCRQQPVRRGQHG